MAVHVAVNQWHFDAFDHCSPLWGQSLIFGEVEIDRQRNAGRADRIGGQDADTPRLDPTSDRLRTTGKERTVFHPEPHPVIGHKLRPA